MVKKLKDVYGAIDRLIKGFSALGATIWEESGILHIDLREVRKNADISKMENNKSD